MGLVKEEFCLMNIMESTRSFNSGKFHTKDTFRKSPIQDYLCKKHVVAMKSSLKCLTRVTATNFVKRGNEGRRLLS